jgi:hypothetical protein
MPRWSEGIDIEEMLQSPVNAAFQHYRQIRQERNRSSRLAPHLPLVFRWIVALRPCQTHQRAFSHCSEGQFQHAQRVNTEYLPLLSFRHGDEADFMGCQIKPRQQYSGVTIQEHPLRFRDWEEEYVAQGN